MAAKGIADAVAARRAVVAVMHGVDAMVLHHEQVQRDPTAAAGDVAMSRAALHILHRLQATVSREAEKVAEKPASEM